MKPAEKRNPLSVIKLASYDLTEKGRFTENLDMLSALKTAQSRFLKRIVRLHPEEVKRPYDLEKCGNWIFFRRYETGERLFAGGYICRNPFCLPCAFRWAYASALELYKHVRVMVERNPHLVPFLLLHSGICGGDLADQYKAVKVFYRKQLRKRHQTMPHIYGSIASYYLGICSDCSKPSFAVNEFILLDASQGLEIPYPPEFSISSADLFRAIFEVFLCNVINAEGNLTADQQFDAIRVHGCAMLVQYGCFKDFVPPDNLASDPADDALADQPFSEEQYRYDWELKAYVLEKVNTGDDMQFPFAVQVPRGRGVQTHLKRQNKAIKRQRFSRLVQGLNAVRKGQKELFQGFPFSGQSVPSIRLNTGF